MIMTAVMAMFVRLRSFTCPSLRRYQAELHWPTWRSKMDLLLRKAPGDSICLHPSHSADSLEGLLACAHSTLVARRSLQKLTQKSFLFAFRTVFLCLSSVCLASDQGLLGDFLLVLRTEKEGKKVQKSYFLTEQPFTSLLTSRSGPVGATKVAFPRTASAARELSEKRVHKETRDLPTI